MHDSSTLAGPRPGADPAADRTLAAAIDTLMASRWRTLRGLSASLARDGFAEGGHVATNAPGAAADDASDAPAWLDGVSRRTPELVP